MKLYTYFLLLSILLINLSCSSSSDPFYEGLKVATTPGNAGIFLNGKYYGNTPLSVEVSEGTYTLSIKRTGYNEVSKKISIPNNDYLDLKSIQLVKNDSVSIFGPMTVAINSIKDSNSLCAICIKEGKVVKYTDPSADFYVKYDSTKMTFALMRCPGKNTSFYKSNQTNWTAAYKAPKADGSWAIGLSDIKNFCFYIYDSEYHYSMFQIDEESDLATGVIILKWAYNHKLKDQSF